MINRGDRVLLLATMPGERSACWAEAAGSDRSGAHSWWCVFASSKRRNTDEGVGCGEVS